MDINPVNPGHALAVAKGHWPTVDVIPPEVLAAVAQTAQKVAKAAFKELSAARREPAAGQRRGRRPERAAPAHPHHAARQGATTSMLNWEPKPGDMAEIEAIYQKLKAALP